jgi:hypothetical protein
MPFAPPSTGEASETRDMMLPVTSRIRRRRSHRQTRGDLVMADWQAEWNMARILAAARRTDGPVMDDARLPRYLRRQQHEIPLRPEEMLA